MSTRRMSEDGQRMYTASNRGGFELYQLNTELDYFAFVKYVHEREDAAAWLAGKLLASDEEE